MPRTGWMSIAVSTWLAAATLVAAQAPAPATHVANTYLQADIEYGATVFARQCSTCHGPAGDGVPGFDLRSGKFRNANTDGDLNRLITTGLPPMPAIKIEAADLAAVVAYLRNMNSFDAGSVKPGDPTRGRAIAEGKGACLSCHQINFTGSPMAPDLSDIGARRSAGYLQRTLTDPDLQMLPINRSVRIVTKDGKRINGRRLNEDTYTVQITDETGSLMSFVKADLREYTILTKSQMPSFKDKLSADELADVLSYLLSLKG